MGLSSGNCWTIQQGQKVVDFVIVPKPWKNNLKLMTEKIMRPRQKQWSLLQELNCLTELQTKVFSFQFTGWWWLMMMMMMMMKHTYGKSDLWAWKNSDIIHMKRWMKWNKMKWNEESWMRGQQMYPLTIHLNMWTVSFGRQHTKAPLAAALSPFVSLLYPPNPWCEWYDEWRLTTSPGSTSPTLFEQWCGFFYVPQEQISESAVRRDLRFFVLIRED